jgi:hypothetical protein
LLVDHYQVETSAMGRTLLSARLGDLPLGPWSRVAFLAELEREFDLNLEELRSIAARDCSMARMIDVCQHAELRGGPASEMRSIGATSGRRPRRS